MSGRGTEIEKLFAESKIFFTGGHLLIKFLTTSLGKARTRFPNGDEVAKKGVSCQNSLVFPRNDIRATSTFFFLISQ
jgi:hypothetical protein